ncbi:unnamed protein product [Aphanomyces euteiches]
MGAGYVGGPTMAVISKFCPSINVTVVDVSEKQIARWNSDDFNLPIYEPGLVDLVKENRGRNLFFSTDIDRHVKEADLIFVCVNTPTKVTGIGAGSAADTKNVELCARMIAEYATSDKIVVEKSTVPVHTAEVLTTVFNANSQSNIHFEVLSNPEFLSEGTAVHDLMSPSRVLIGGANTSSGQTAVQKLVSIYEHWIPRGAAFVHAFVSSPSADVTEVARAVGTDPRIGDKFLQVSVGFGGSCFQKDVLNLVYLAESFHLTEVAAYWRSVVTMNEYQKNRFAMHMVRTMFNSVTNKKIGIFGFAYKKDTGDTRETPAAAVIKTLVTERAKVFVYDPKVEVEDLVNELRYHGMTEDEVRSVEFVRDPYQVVDKAHALAVMTDWEEFKTYDYTRIHDCMLKPAFLFDGRNLLPHEDLQRVGFTVHGIGKKQ